MAEADQPGSSETPEQSMARQSREVARRLAEQQAATEREQTPPSTQPSAPPARVARAMETLWTARTDGSENLSGRTPIVLRPGVPHYTTSETVDPGRESQWIQRGMTPLPLTPEQKEDMIRLRSATVEFAHFSANASYIPPGYNIDDLLRLYMARAPPILEENSLHTRMMTGELLALKGKLAAEISGQMAQVQARLDGVEHHVRQQRRRMESTEVQVAHHQAQWDNWAAEEPWLEENTTEPTEYNTTSATPQQSAHTGQVPSEQPSAPANGQAQAPDPQAPAPVPAAAGLGPAEAPGFEGIPHIAGHPEWAIGHQPAEPSGKDKMQFVSHMRKVPLFHANKPPSGQTVRSWPEWKLEFEQNASLAETFLRIDPGPTKQLYYAVALTLLGPSVRDTWLGSIDGQPHMATWQNMDSEFTAWYGSKDKRAAAEAKFLRTELKKDIEAAWQTYHTSQTQAISDMRGPDRPFSEAGIWNTFLGGLIAVPTVHNQAYTYWTNHTLEFAPLTAQGRISKLIPHISNWINTVAAGQRNRQNNATAGAAAGAGTATGAGAADNNTRPAKRKRGAQTGQSGQLYSDTEYTAIPEGSAKDCADVGYQFNGDPKPYAHSLRALLQSEGRCLVCWSPDHIMYSCPERSQGLKQHPEVVRPICCPACIVYRADITAMSDSHHRTACRQC